MRKTTLRSMPYFFQRLVMVSLVFLIPSITSADWQYTNWGDSPEAVISKSDGIACYIDRTYRLLATAQQIALAGHEGMAQTQARDLQETAISPSGM